MTMWVFHAPAIVIFAAMSQFVDVSVYPGTDADATASFSVLDGKDFQFRQRSLDRMSTSSERDMRKAATTRPQ
jgi:hypothetical protein